jgi:site-specific DNA recombinase
VKHLELSGFEKSWPSQRTGAGRPMSPSHTRRRGQIYRYYVTREAIADGYDACPVTSVPAADVEGAVLDHVQKLLAAPELVARTWATTKGEAT